jgi:hypothetical protein
MVAAQNDPQRVHLSPQPPAAPTPGSVRCPQRRPAQQATVAPPFFGRNGAGDQPSTPRKPPTQCSTGHCAESTTPPHPPWPLPDKPAIHPAVPFLVPPQMP